METEARPLEEKGRESFFLEELLFGCFGELGQRRVSRRVRKSEIPVVFLRDSLERRARGGVYDREKEVGQEEEEGQLLEVSGRCSLIIRR